LLGFPIRRLISPSRRFLRLAAWGFGCWLLPTTLSQVLWQLGVLAERSIRSNRTFEDDTGLGHGRVDDVLICAFPRSAWWNRLLSAPQASKAAFIDGAAIACSKNPNEV
jgi:hypothetical protein